VTQTPAPGYVLTTANSSTTVIIKATGSNGKSSQVSFRVALADTITPKITPIGVLAEYQLNQAKELYNAGDRIVRYISEVTNRQPWVDSIAGLKDQISDSAKMLIVTSYQGKRVIAFADTISLINR
jgi:hypothetical protein